MNYRENNRGFTLVELLVVITIIGVLATLILLQLNRARTRARDTRRIADMTQLRSALELYFDDNGGSYPASDNLAILAPKYVATLPQDPVTSPCTPNVYDGASDGALNCYGYVWNPLNNPTSFQVWAELELWNATLNSDADIDSSTWFGAGLDGSDDASCLDDTSIDCVYDIGH